MAFTLKVMLKKTTGFAGGFFIREKQEYFLSASPQYKFLSLITPDPARRVNGIGNFAEEGVFPGFLHGTLPGGSVPS